MRRPRLLAERVRKNSAITRVVREACDRLYDGYLRGDRTAFERFVQEVDRDVEFMASKIFRRWQMPASEEIADLKQELYTEIVRILPKYDPRRALAADFLVWNAFAKGKKQSNRARCPVDDRPRSERVADPRGADRLPSRCAMSASAYASADRPETQDEILDRLSRRASLSAELDPESIAASRELLTRICAAMAESDARLYVLLVESYGDVAAAVRGILDRDPSFARGIGAESEDAMTMRFNRAQRAATATAHVLGLIELPSKISMRMRDAIEDARARTMEADEDDGDDEGDEEQEGGTRDGKDSAAGRRDSTANGSRGVRTIRSADRGDDGRDREPARSVLRARVA